MSWIRQVSFHGASLSCYSAWVLHTTKSRACGSLGLPNPWRNVSGANRPDQGKPREIRPSTKQMESTCADTENELEAHPYRGHTLCLVQSQEMRATSADWQLPLPLCTTQTTDIIAYGESGFQRALTSQNSKTKANRQALSRGHYLPKACGKTLQAPSCVHISTKYSAFTTTYALEFEEKNMSYWILSLDDAIDTNAIEGYKDWRK